MNNFITGAAGFIAGTLIKKIGGTCYDNFLVPNAIEPKCNQVYKADVLDYKTLSNAMKGHNIVWHLAASSEVGNPKTDVDLQNNIIGTYNVLEAMRENGISQLVFSSSATYYGSQCCDCYEMMSSSPTSLYGASKVSAEALISAYSNLYGIQAWVFRFGNVVGGNMGHGVIYDFIKKLRDNPKQLDIIGNGKQERPFFLVEDCIDGMLCALKNPPDTYNLAPIDTINVDGIAKIVMEEMKLSNVKIKYTNSPLWDVPSVKLDISKIKGLGWKPKCNSKEAVRIATRRLLA